MSDNIQLMNDKQLRNKVQELSDALAIMQRKYEDLLYNLDTDNFSSRFVKEQDDMKTAIDVTAKGIESKVSNEEFESTKTQLADRITSEVKTLGDADKQLSSKIEQTEEKIRIEISTNEYVNSNAHYNFNSAINMTAKKIESVLSKNISAKFISNYNPNTITTSEKQKGMLCEYDGTLYYYNDISGKWKVYPYADGVKSQFLQTADGFKLTGDVSISGDAIVGGEITGSSLLNSGQTTKLKLGTIDGSNYGDMALYRLYNGSEKEIFKVYDDVSCVELQVFGKGFLYSTGSKTYPLGEWDFSGTDIKTTAKFA